MSASDDWICRSNFALKFQANVPKLQKNILGDTLCWILYIWFRRQHQTVPYFSACVYQCNICLKTCWVTVLCYRHHCELLKHVFPFITVNTTPNISVTHIFMRFFSLNIAGVVFVNCLVMSSLKKFSVAPFSLHLRVSVHFACIKASRCGQVTVVG